MNRLRADLCLLFAALIWGTTFVVQKNANENIGPISFVGFRFLLSAVVLFPLALWESKRKSKLKIRYSDAALAVCVGLSLLCGAGLQQFALVATTATNGGFLTSLYVLLVPFMVWVGSRKKPRIEIFVACAVSVFGAWLLSTGGKSLVLSGGDLIILVSDFAWAANIVLIPVFLNRVPRPFFLSFIQYLVTGLGALAVGLAIEPFAVSKLQAVGFNLFYAGVISGGIAFTLQVVAQGHAPPSEASILMGLESVFAALSGVFLLGEHMDPVGLLGCCLILFGVMLAELYPLYFRKGRG